MATTSPDLIYSPDTSSVAALATELATMATSVQTALTAIPAAWGQYTAYTPTAVSGFVVVNGALTGGYSQIGKWVTAEINYTVGSSDTFSAAMVFSTPVVSRSSYTGNFAWGKCVMLDTSVGTSSRRTATVSRNGTSSVFLLVDSLATAAAVTSTVPWTWATGDTILMKFEYFAA